MAAGSDLLDDVFFNTEVDEKVVSDLVGSLESELTGARHVNATADVPPAANHVGSSNDHGSKMGLSQQELAKAGVQGGGFTVDGAAGNTSSMTAAQSEPKPGAAGGVVPVVSGVGKPGTVNVQTLNGSAVVMNCHITGGGGNNNNNNKSQPAATPINNGPVSLSKGSETVLTATPSAIVRTSPDAAISSVKSVPTVTLVRPPMQTPPAVGVTCAAGSLAHKPDPAKTITQTGAHVVASVTRSPTVLQNLRTSVPSPIAATVATVTPPGGIRAIAPQVLAPRLAQAQPSAPNIQNIQLPPGMVLVRSESGQLLVIHQQTLAQMQAQSQSQSAMTPRPAAPTSTPPVQITSHQAPGASLLTRPVTPTTIIKQGSTVQTTVTATTTLQRPPVQQNTIMLGGTATAPGQPLGTPTPMQPGAAVTQRAVAPTAVSAETLENVKKCRNFLSTLIKLASGGKQSSETAANVKELVKNLLEAKIDPEDFTSRLYRELNSSPQPYLVPFLKRSLPALRQMTPDPEAFIQQSLLPLPSTTAAAASTALTAVMQRPPLAAPAAAVPKTTVISVSQTPPSKQMVAQQHGTMVRPQVTLAQSPMVTLRGQSHSRIIVGHPQVVKQLPTAMKQTLAPGARGVQVVSQTSLAAAQRNRLKEAGAAAFRDDDDINDVASMAGVNLSEESARILATNSALVGTVTRSCKDEAFLATSLLTRRALEIGKTHTSNRLKKKKGRRRPTPRLNLFVSSPPSSSSSRQGKKFGVGELGADVINFISHAAQQRLQSLLEKVSQVALQKNTTFKEDARWEQVSDVRSQLRFFEQLDQMEKQRKEEQEREILLKAAKSRSRQEDPEQLRLKQKAKEMQQLELAQIRQREANFTALAAIGPRKKRKMDSPVSGASAEGSGSDPSQPGGSDAAGSRQLVRHRITRVNLKDLLFCLENERETSRSQLLYKGFLK
ncbi:transcription initiation factor TFIID subunit 4 isoform X2 [Pseudoliparis swirei]|uniref:transcription initiation factor TFIID subunit 4 isoform X2 n=1 Tax=Pseudoliparis swirei TaxID=2059687 RepID=UPI0024BD97D4|nr:transcription initiation factor TFIID subunit 4 isoform X2 [Pseudoliparis swirei]